MKNLKTIGRVEKISFPELEVKGIHAKIDTGADLSSIWVTNIKEENGVLSFKLFGRSSPYYSDKKIEIPAPQYLHTRIANSFGQRELRYVIKLQVRIRGKLVRATFTLANRTNKTYPILIGRKLLQGKFLVDVSKGSPLRELESNKKSRMKKELQVLERWEKTA